MKISMNKCPLQIFDPLIIDGKAMIVIEMEYKSGGNPACEYTLIDGAEWLNGVNNVSRLMRGRD